MRNLTIGPMAVLCVLWAGAGWAGDKALVPQTGQELCYDTKGVEIFCRGTGQDGDLQEGVPIPTPRYTDKGDGTIEDNLTGLIWLKNANCPGTARNWQTALNDVASLNTSGKMNGNDCGDTSGKRGSHKTDWRLPNVRELSSLIDFAFSDPAISNAAGTGNGNNSDPFSNWQSLYWSSTTVPVRGPGGYSAWVVVFGNGGIVVGNNKNTTIFRFVTAVRGDSRLVPQTGQELCYDSVNQIFCRGTGQDGDLQEGVPIPTPRYTDKGDGTIEDNLTGLIWLKNANCPNGRRTWQQALDDVASLNTSGKMNGKDCGDTSGKRGSHKTDWRLPNVRELFSLIDFAFLSPAISNAAGTGNGSNSDPFSNLQSDFYWSSTTVAIFPFPTGGSGAWMVRFFAGTVEFTGKEAILPFVTAVRGDS